MKAYLKRAPDFLGEVAHVYITDYGQKRLTVEFEHGTVIDDAVEEFEVIREETDDVNS